MKVPEAWLAQPYALVHGDDSELRRAAVEAWKARHVDPEWADFSLLVCAEGGPWAEVVNALQEAPPLGTDRVVVVPQADHLLAKPKDLPKPVAALLERPLPGTRLLLVSRMPLPAGPGRPLGSKPWTDWAKAGRILRAGALEPPEAAAYLEAEARGLGLLLDPGLASAMVARVGGHPGILRRTLEVLDLLAEAGARGERRVTPALLDLATFRLAEQGAFAWSSAWQKGDVRGALQALRQAVEDDPGGAPLMLLGQARREVERLCALVEARAAGRTAPGDLLASLGLSPRQGFLLDGYERALAKLKPAGVQRLLGLVGQTDRDLKGVALGGSPSPLASLTLSLCWAFGGR
jgi:DNA polymerase III delta subunit